MPPKAKSTKNDQILDALHQLGGRIEKLENSLSSITNSPIQEEERKKSAPKSKWQQLKRRVLAVLRLPFHNRLLGTLTIVGFLTGSVALWVQLRYDISVMPLASLDSSDPSAMRFLVTNEGPFTIYQVFYTCEYTPPRPPNTAITVHVYPFFAGIPSLRPHGHFSAFCGHPRTYPSRFPEGTLMNVDVWYIPKFLHWFKHGGTLFLLKFDKSNNAVWLPELDLDEKIEDLSDFSCPTCK
jgi:hypothetical protein